MFFCQDSENQIYYESSNPKKFLFLFPHHSNWKHLKSLLFQILIFSFLFFEMLPLKANELFSLVKACVPFRCKKKAFVLYIISSMHCHDVIYILIVLLTMRDKGHG
jgi:hypothetical protein